MTTLHAKRNEHNQVCIKPDYPSWGDCQKVWISNANLEIKTYNFGANFKNMSNDFVKTFLEKAAHILEDHNCSRAYN